MSNQVKNPNCWFSGVVAHLEAGVPQATIENSSGKHVYPIKPHIYIVKKEYTGVYIFYFCSKT